MYNADLVKFRLNVHRVLYKLSMYIYADLIKLLNLSNINCSMYMYAYQIQVKVYIIN